MSGERDGNEGGQDGEEEPDAAETEQSSASFELDRTISIGDIAGTASAVIAVPASVLALSKLSDGSTDSDDASQRDVRELERIPTDIPHEVPSNESPTISESTSDESYPDPTYNKPTPGMSGNWGELLNENFTRIEDEIRFIVDELQDKDERIANAAEEISEIRVGRGFPHVTEQDELPDLSATEGALAVASDTTYVYEKRTDTWEWIGKLDYTPELQFISDELVKTIERLREEVEENEEEIEEREEEIDELREEVDELREEIHELREEVSRP